MKLNALSVIVIRVLRNFSHCHAKHVPAKLLLKKIAKDPAISTAGTLTLWQILRPLVKCCAVLISWL
jgi:hypothetical protein